MAMSHLDWAAERLALTMIVWAVAGALMRIGLEGEGLTTGAG